MYYLYVLKHTNGDTYVGYTSSLSRRLQQHNSGLNTSTIRGYGRWNLVYYEAYRSKIDVLLREKRLKMRGATKYNLFKRIDNSMFMLESYSEDMDRRSIRFGF